MAKCRDCGKEMLKANGCTFTHFQYKGQVIKRSLEWQEPGERCHDCGALAGYPHHLGCDAERCPICGNQLISCDCFGEGLEVELIAVRKRKPA